MQRHSMQDSHIVSPACMVQALPPSSLMPFGRGDTVLITHKSSELLSPVASKCMCILIPYNFFVSQPQNPRVSHCPGESYNPACY
jgi:hypothetical protein